MEAVALSIFIAFTFDAQREGLVGKKELYRSVRALRRLKKAARQCWAR